MLLSYGYYLLNNVPTRVTENPATIIDHMITIDHTHQMIPVVIKADLTDHFPISCKIFDFSVKKNLKPIYQRNFSKF